MRKSALTDYISNHYPNAYCLYTDGSKIGNKVGSAVYDPYRNRFMTTKLCEEASIYTAELVAILMSLKYMGSLSEKKFLILSDSLSALHRLTNSHGLCKMNHIIAEIVERIALLKEESVYVHFLWVRGHSGVKGNEVVDTLAKDATENGGFEDYKVPMSDLRGRITKTALQMWQTTLIVRRVNFTSVW
ncbi:uncharacterized protein [Rhodnius prolixus]|uniref:uncharacterized protein n=1 Tax=Rhodnius prolixus TaxID=13249 RepID=UPI003D18E4E1